MPLVFYIIRDGKKEGLADIKSIFGSLDIPFFLWFSNYPLCIIHENSVRKGKPKCYFIGFKGI